MNTSSVFRAPQFSFHSIDTAGYDTGTIRVSDQDGILYDFKVQGTDKYLLADIVAQPAMYDIVTVDDYNQARVKFNNMSSELPPIGHSNMASVYCEILVRGINTPPAVVGMTMVTSNRSASTNKPMVYSLAPTMTQSNPDYDPNDEQAAKQRSGGTPGITASAEGGITIGQGPNGMNLNQKSGLTMDVDNQTHKTQESNHGGGMFTTSLNFLQHYFIGLANAVALPMPHMVNIVKMVAIGKFVKQIIGKKGKRVDNKDGTSTWQDGTGIYGLGDAVNEYTKFQQPGKNSVLGQIRRDLGI